MKHKITRDKVLKSIIRLVNEYREDLVEEDAKLGRLHIGIPTIEWVYDWLAEEFATANMTRPSKDEISKLLQGDTIGTLANLAMKHIDKDAEYDDGEAEKKEAADIKKEVSFFFENGDAKNCCISATSDPKMMTRGEFLKRCGEFYDDRYTRINDYEFMSVRISERNHNA